MATQDSQDQEWVEVLAAIEPLHRRPVIEVRDAIEFDHHGRGSGRHRPIAEEPGHRLPLGIHGRHGVHIHCGYLQPANQTQDQLRAFRLRDPRI